MPKHLVLVTGAPGSGKSTVAPRLAEALELPLVMKDAIKEAMHNGLGWGDITEEQSHQLGAATYEVIWAVASLMPSVLIECNFRPDNDQQRAHIIALNKRPVEVYCRVPTDVAAQRYIDRAKAGLRHPVHVVDELALEVIEAFDRPLGLGPVFELDTTKPVDDDVISSVAADVRAALLLT